MVDAEQKMKKESNVDVATVVMAVHNGERFLSAQLTSVLHELGPWDELIVIDDASSDGSAQLLESIQDPRIRIHRNDSNLGIRSSFEKGLRLASAPVIFLCDQDDIWLPGKRSAFMAVFQERAEVMVVVSDAQIIDAEGNIRRPSFMATRGGFRGRLAETLVRNRYLGCCMAFRRQLLDRVLPIPSAIPMHDMWIGSIGSIVGEVRYLPKPYLQYRRHGGNASPARRQGWGQMIKWRIQLLLAVVSRMCKRRGRWQDEASDSTGGESR